VGLGLWERACPAKRPAQTLDVYGQGFALVRGASPLPQGDRVGQGSLISYPNDCSAFNLGKLLQLVSNTITFSVGTPASRLQTVAEQLGDRVW